MKDKKFEKALVMGTGMMGPGIALTLAQGGLQVKLVGRTDQSAERGMKNFQTCLKRLRDQKLLRVSEASKIERFVSGSTKILAEAAASDLIIESIVEDLKTKRNFFLQLENVCSTSTVFTSNTSGYRITEITSSLNHPERTVTTHFWNPPYLIPLVEVIMGDRSSPEIAQSVYDLLKKCGKSPVLIRKDVPGQLGNRLLHAVIREAAYMVQEGICTAEDIDTAVKNGFGLRFPVFGPLDHTDIVGVDLVASVQTSLAPHLCNVPECLPILREKVDRRELGASTGKGFYDWSIRNPDKVRRIRDEFIIRRLKERKKGY
jgi:3-hydroxybutyryl-CoA dehydrogenase